VIISGQLIKVLLRLCGGQVKSRKTLTASFGDERLVPRPARGTTKGPRFAVAQK
jgi:hypothetical protein